MVLWRGESTSLRETSLKRFGLLKLTLNDNPSNAASVLTLVFLVIFFASEMLVFAGILRPKWVMTATLGFTSLIKSTKFFKHIWPGIDLFPGLKTLAIRISAPSWYCGSSSKYPVSEV